MGINRQILNVCNDMILEIDFNGCNYSSERSLNGGKYFFLKTE